MDKINRNPISNYPALSNLEKNWKQWGIELKQYNDTNAKSGQRFSWRERCDVPLRKLLPDLTKEHCSFCDGFPIGETSLEPIEHYHPKAKFPLKAYQWENLFYCCDKCNSEANKSVFEYTLKPDDDDYRFSTYFYFDSSDGKVKVIETLKIESPNKYVKAEKFLKRYGINNPKRNIARTYLMNDVKNFLKSENPNDKRQRKDFKYRYIFDYIERLLSI